MRFLCFFLFLIFCSCKNREMTDLLIESDFIKIESACVFDTLHYNVKVMNLGTSEIHIDTLVTSCECVSIEKGVKLLKPNQMDSVKIRFVAETSGYVSRGFSIKYNKKVKNVIIEGYVRNTKEE